MSFAKTRGQVSIEFFVLLAFLIVISSLLLNTIQGQASETQKLDKAALSKTALNSVAFALNYVFLSGNGSKITQQVFVPKGVFCFIYNSSDKTLECDIGISKKVHSLPLYADIPAPNCSYEGWLNIEAQNLNGNTSLSCTKVS